MKSKVLKGVRNVLISAGALLILVVGGGVAYTWYMGQQPSSLPAASTPPAEVAPAPTIKPIKPAANAKESAAIQMLTSPVMPGTNASVTVKTNAGSHCTVKVEYNKVRSTDSGLAPKSADDFGIVSWTWTVESTVPLGTWPVEVTCVYNDQSAVVKGDLVVAKQVDE